MQLNEIDMVPQGFIRVFTKSCKDEQTGIRLKAMPCLAIGPSPAASDILAIKGIQSHSCGVWTGAKPSQQVPNLLNCCH